MVLLLTFISWALAATPSPGCPTTQKLNPKGLTPVAIQKYIQDNQLKSVEDLTCCIANMPNISIVIIPFSIAGQNADYLNPRVLLVNTDPNTQSGFVSSTVNTIFSINSGASHLNQNNAVEMVTNVNGPGDIIYSDIPFSNGQGHVSGNNPEECMTCHGNGGEVPANGPRSLFDRAPWGRLLMDTSVNSEGKAFNSRDIFGEHLCTERAKLDPLLEKATMNVINTNPRFACIKNKPRANVGVLDAQLAQMNIPRIIKFMKATPDYQTFKYVIAAAEVCMLKPEDFIPIQILRTMNNQDSLAPDIRKIMSVISLNDYQRKKTASLIEQANAQDARMQDIGRTIQNNQSIQNIDDSMTNKFCGGKPTDLRAIPNWSRLFYPSNNAVFNRYETDSRVKGVNESQLRYIFESRGISISDWSMSPTGELDRGYNLDVAIRDSEPVGSPLRNAMDITNPEERCNKLKELSQKAFKAQSANASFPNIVQ